MFKRFKIHIDDHFSEFKGKKLLLAVSGGIDSMVLCNLLMRLNYNCSIAHCNFNLRGDESDLDEELVKVLAEKRNIPFFSKHFDTVSMAQQQKISIQMAARDLRYAWFNDLIADHNFDYLVTAHHADDAIETFMINLSRGTGLDGLTGIPEKSGKIRRPLLPFSKEEIQGYARKEGITWREDLSNQDNKYVRNSIRNELIPILKGINPSFTTSFLSTLKNLQESRLIINDQIETVLEKVIDPSDNHAIVKYKTKDLAKYAKNLSYYFEIFNTYGFDQTDEIASLISAQSGKQLLSNSHRLLKDREHLLVTKLDDKDKKTQARQIQISDQFIDLEELSIEFDHLLRREFSNDIFNASTANFDKNLLTFPLTVRKWEKGDYFYPIGMNGKKKLSKFFKDEKYSLLEKENIWLLCSGLDVIWVIGKRMDDRYKITDKTTHILKATVKT